MSVNEQTQLNRGERVIKLVKREEIERSRDRTRSIEINMMRELMRRYPEQARDVVADLLKLSLTKTAA